jgi:hypothetical protein
MYGIAGKITRMRHETTEKKFTGKTPRWKCSGFTLNQTWKRHNHKLYRIIVAAFGRQRPEVRILSPRPFKSIS